MTVLKCADLAVAAGPNHEEAMKIDGRCPGHRRTAASARCMRGSFVARGAAKVYGAARRSGRGSPSRPAPVALDITDPDRVGQVAAAVRGRQPLSTTREPRSTAPSPARRTWTPRAEMAMNLLRHVRLWHALRRCWRRRRRRDRQYALVTSFYTDPFDASYSASKAGGLVAHQGVRLELATSAPGERLCTPASSIPTWPP